MKKATIKKRRYKVERDEHGGEYCTTKCPLGKAYFTIPICVGSGECHRCSRFVDDDKEKQVVSCKSTK